MERMNENQKAKAKANACDRRIPKPMPYPLHSAPVAYASRNGFYGAGPLLASGLPLQAKLEVGSPDDPLEAEADAVADRVMHSPVHAGKLDLKITGNPSEVDPELDTDSLTDRILSQAEATEFAGSPRIQAKLEMGSPADPLEHEADRVAEQVVSTLKTSRIEGSADALKTRDVTLRSESPLPESSGQALPPSVRSDFEARFGRDFGAVRIHTGPKPAIAAGNLGARAFTAGADIVFGQGQFAPGTPVGDHLLAHELTHVVQQGRVPRPGEQGALGNYPVTIRRAPSKPSELIDPIANDLPGYGFFSVGPVFSALPAVESDIRQVLVEFGLADENTLGECVVQVFKWVNSDPYYFAYIHPKLGVVARAYGSKSGYDWSNNPSKPIVLYSVYAYTTEQEANQARANSAGAPIRNPTPYKGKMGGTGNVITPDAEKEKKAGNSGVPKPEDKAPTGGNGKDTGNKKGSGVGSGTGVPPPVQSQDSNSKGIDPNGIPEAKSPEGKGKDPLGTDPKAEPKKSDDDPKVKQVRALPQEIKDLLFGGNEPMNLAPERAEQLLRIADKLQKISAEDRKLYRLLIKHLTDDLDALDRSIDLFIQFKERYRLAIEEAGKKKPDADKEKSLEQKLADTWTGFDDKAWENADVAGREKISRDYAGKQRNIQLEHMAKHPGETAANMVEGVVRVDKVGKDVYDDIKDAANGDKGGFARWAAGVGATGKISGWVAGAAAIAYIALLFIPGVNVVVLLQTALYAGIAAIILSTVESELRIKAAGEARTETEFKEQTQKAAAAQANAIVGAALLAIGLSIKLIARIPLPGKLQNVGAALNSARVALSKATGAGAAWRAIKGPILEKLRGAGKGAPEALVKEGRALADLSKRVEGMTGKELVEKLAVGDKELLDATQLKPDQIQQIAELAKTDAGKVAAEQLRKDLLRALKDAPEQAAAQVNDTMAKLNEATDAIDAAMNADELKAAVEKAEKILGQEEAQQTGKALQDNYVQNRLTEERFKTKTDAEVKAETVKDPTAVDELIRRYEKLTIKELQKLAKAGDATAEYVIAKRRAIGHRNPAEVPVRPSNLVVLDRLKARLAQIRGASKIPKQGSSGGTFGVAETDLPLKTTEFDGGSPKTGLDADPTYKPPSEVTSAQAHAEQNLVGALKKAIGDAKIGPDAMKGKKVYMVIEQEVCPTCKAGLYSDSPGAGVLKQFSAEFPDLLIEISNLESGEVIRIQGGKLIP